ncbi:phytoene desaturase family protein [Amycolatopsis marina]|uniref:phytoene desaturase family protein n=1 Tax=Amycolatopsis marina TaxID=490629 RepID=UPI0015A68DAA|nr:NAD(P)/FAD-dependent oxidoreductase [Amycolatopsis marina]
MTESYDVVVIGAGHNGLVCAAYLGQAGYRVAVVERRELVGGACITEEIFPGHRFSTASLVTTLFRKEIIDDLSLAKHGMEVLERDPSVTALLPDGRYLTFSADSAKMAAEIGKFSEQDADKYFEYGDAMRRIARFAEPYLLGGSRKPLLEDIPALKAALGAATALGDKDLRLLVSTLFGSAREVLDEWFESEALKVTLATDGTVGIDGGPSMPGTAYLLLYHQMGATEDARPSWGQVKGGMGSITKALAAACAEFGVDIFTGQAAERILLGDGARGVELVDGTRLDARVVVSGADPKATFEKLLEPGAVPASYRAALAGREYPGVAAKVHLALDHLPGVRGFDGFGEHFKGTLQILPDMDHLDRVHAEAKAGIPPAQPHVECTVPSILDPGLAPPGKHVMSMYLQYLPYQPAGTTWDEIRESYLDTLLAYVEPYLPGLTAAVTDRRLFTPADIERELALPGGNLYHGAMSPRDLFAGRPVGGYADYHTPVPGLFLCGSGTRPGGGVFGIPGKNASETIRRHFEEWRHEQ